MIHTRSHLLLSHVCDLPANQTWARAGLFSESVTTASYMLCHSRLSFSLPGCDFIPLARADLVLDTTGLPPSRSLGVGFNCRQPMDRFSVSAIQRAAGAQVCLPADRRTPLSTRLHTSFCLEGEVVLLGELGELCGAVKSYRETLRSITRARVRCIVKFVYIPVFVSKYTQFLVLLNSLETERVERGGGGVSPPSGSTLVTPT